jgi:predicted ATPase/DNA-binding CsgD family transcriptional regulator
MPHETADDVSHSPPLIEQLTKREETILGLMAEGFSDQEIADKLSVALDTVKWYNKRIYGKLDVHNRTQAVVRAKAMGLLDRDGHADQSSVSVATPAFPKNNLPAPMSSFVGRRREIAAVKHALEKSRLITLTGIGGSGKTRLALQAAIELLFDFADGVYFVPLAAVTSADRILWSIAEHLNFRFDTQSEPRQQLLNYLGQKSLLIVLDNFDHLIAGAGLLEEILQAAPALKLIVTSRERLNLYGEVIYPVAGMALPDELHRGDAARAEAVQLFVERAQLVSPHLVWTANDLPQITRICHLIEGIPLGIELAATWVDTLSPHEIADEIEHNLDILELQRQDIPNSQRSVRAAFDRSWHLLDEAQRSAFRRLSVFRGGFTREASEVVAGVGLRTLQALVNKSLVRRNPNTGRYEFHELLRHYAAEHLNASGESEHLYHAHATYFAAFMEERWPRMKDARQNATVQEVEADIENVRFACQYWFNARQFAEILKFLHTFWAVYDIRGLYLAGIDLFNQGIAAMRTADTVEARAGLGWVLAIQGLYYIAGEISNRSATPAPSWMGDFNVYTVRGEAQRGYALAREGVDILKQLNAYEEMLFLPLMSLFITSCLLDEEDAPLQIAQECLELATRIGDKWAIAKAKQLLAVQAIGDADYQRAEQLARESLETFDANGDNWSKSVLCTEVLGLLAIRRRQFDAAKQWMQQGLRAAEDIDFKYAIQTAYWQLGFVATLEENYSEAGLYWHKALDVAEHILGGTSFLGFGRGRSLQ